MDTEYLISWSHLQLVFNHRLQSWSSPGKPWHHRYRIPDTVEPPPAGIQPQIVVIDLAQLNPGIMDTEYLISWSTLQLIYNHRFQSYTCSNILLFIYILCLDESCWRIRSSSKNIYCSRKHNKFSSTGIHKLLVFLPMTQNCNIILNFQMFDIY